MAHFGGLFSGRLMVLTVYMRCLAGINFKGITIEMELIRAKTVPRKISVSVAVFSEKLATLCAQGVGCGWQLVYAVGQRD